MDITKLKRPTNATKTPVILFYNGTFAPIHDGHISVITACKNYLENNLDYEVLGAYLSPSHPTYSRKKLKENYIISKHRIELCYLVADMFDWLMVDTWEIMQTEFCFFGLAMPLLYNRLLKYCDFLKETKFYMAWIVGIDSYNPFKFNDIPNYLNICVNNRTGFESNLEFLNEMKGDKELGDKTILVETDKLNISSTMIRNALRSSDGVERFYKSCTKAVDYIKSNDLFNPQVILETKEILNLDFKKRDILCDLKVDFVTKLLQTCKLTSTEQTVLEFNQDDLGVSLSFSGNLLLVNDLKYSTIDENNNLTEFVIKFPGSAAGYYENLEQLFYSKLYIDDPLFIKCYALFKDNKDSILLMEYVKSYVSYSYKDGLSPPFVYLAIRELARFHTLYYKIDLSDKEIPSVTDKNGLDWLNVRLDYISKGLLKIITPELTSKQSPEQILNFLKDMFKQSVDKLQTSSFQSLCHNDFWLQNIMFSPDLVKKLELLKDKDPAVLHYEIGRPRNDYSQAKIFDFEYVSTGCPLIDLAFFLYTSVTTEFLKNHEIDLLKFYYVIICHYGVIDYSYSQCLSDYTAAKWFALPRLLSTFGVSCFTSSHTNNASRNIKYLIDSLIKTNDNQQPSNSARRCILS